VSRDHDHPSLPSLALADFPANRWATLRRDLANFLGSPWAAEAVQLGWSDLDLSASTPMALYAP
jgi:hypothetical protein